MESPLGKPVLVLGAGGHARVLIDVLSQSSSRILGITDPDSKLWGHNLMGVPILGNDDKIVDYSPQDVVLVNALGSVSTTKARAKLYDFFKAKGYGFETVIHPKAIIAPHVGLAEGVQVLAGAIINTGVSIGVNTIVNTGAVVEHDCLIGSHVHIATGSRLAGNVNVGNGTHIGIGSTIIQNLTLGENCLIAAGAVVVTSCKAGAVMMGVPAKHRER
jgi:UDP-perosamine 4-acetyltransferase